MEQKITTEIIFLNEGEKEKDDTIYHIDDDNLSKTIVDLTLPSEIRIEALNRYYSKYGDNAIEIVNKIGTMYEISNTKVLRQYLFEISQNSILHPLIQSMACKTLHNHNEKDELAYKAIDTVYQRFGDDIGTPYKIDFVKILMKNSDYKDKALVYFCNIIDDSKIDCSYRYKTILSLEKETWDTSFFILKACLKFAFNDKNDIRTRILASQNLLSKKIVKEDRKKLEENLLIIANNEQLDVNIRADATDVLLQLGTEQTKILAEKLIAKLGSDGKRVNTIYDNSQNVHTKEVTESIKEAIEFLQNFDVLEYKGSPINFEYVENKIYELDESKKEQLKVALNRINMDRALYSEYNCRLTHILLKIWSYICGHESEEELKKRLVQELYDMAYTCSSGFATRLINTISGFGDFSIRISWRDQIAGNLAGRLNSLIREMDNLKLQEKILFEMTLETSNYEERKNFLKFLRANLPRIKEELYKEFKPYMPDETFDLYFRSAISTYEGNI